MWRRAIVLCALTALGCGDGGQRERSASAQDGIALQGCYMTVHLFEADRARMRPLVPARYRFGRFARSQRATLAFWVVACDAIRVGAEPPLPGVLSLVGVQVRSPLRPWMPEAPATFDHYLLFGHTDHPALAERLRAAGLPGEQVPGIRFRHGRPTVATVPWRRGTYTLRLRGVFEEAPHDHLNTYWHDGPDGAAQLEIVMRHATDRNCGRCPDSRVAAVPGSPVAGVLGARALTRPRVAFDHDKIAGGAALVVPARPLPAPGPAGLLGVEGRAADRRGVLVARVLERTPAERAGLRRGDVILAVNGTAVTTHHELMARVGDLGPGSRATLTVVREGKQIGVAATIARRPAAPAR